MNAITGKPCAQVIPAGAVVTQDVTLAANPCNFKPSDPLQIAVVTGGEPPVSSFTVRGDSVGVGESATEPFKLKLKGYQGCQPSAEKKGAKKAGAKKAATGGVPINLGLCTGTVSPKDPAKPGIDAKYQFSCAQNIRAFSIVSSRTLDFFGFEPEVHGDGANSVPCIGQAAADPPPPTTICALNESALHQCEGPIPHFGFGCAIANRQSNISPNNSNGRAAPNAYGQRLSAGNTLTGELGLPTSPCKKQKGEPKLKFWVIAMNEPVITPPNGGSPTTGEFMSDPYPLTVSGWSKGACPKPKGKGGKKK
ncbi:MAG: hypothetical protein ACRDK5_00690 [Solirubrobacterales bacterium]